MEVSHNADDDTIEVLALCCGRCRNLEEALATAEVVNTVSVAERARKRIMWRVVPYMFLLFVIAYLDRVNLSYAVLTMKGDLSFSDDILGLGAGIFFIGYFFLEIPGTILVEKWSARGWIARIMVTWGIVAIA